MIIKLGDTIKDERGREGEVVNIGIATDKSDIAGELGLSAKEYDTELNYTGAVSFGSNWCYFNQIKEVVKKNEFVSDTTWMSRDFQLHRLCPWLERIEARVRYLVSSPRVRTSSMQVSREPVLSRNDSHHEDARESPQHVVDAATHSCYPHGM